MAIVLNAVFGERRYDVGGTAVVLIIAAVEEDRASQLMQRCKQLIAVAMIVEGLGVIGVAACHLAALVLTT